MSVKSWSDVLVEPIPMLRGVLGGFILPDEQ